MIFLLKINSLYAMLFLCISISFPFVLRRKTRCILLGLIFIKRYPSEQQKHLSSPSSYQNPRKIFPETSLFRGLTVLAYVHFRQTLTNHALCSNIFSPLTINLVQEQIASIMSSFTQKGIHRLHQPLEQNHSSFVSPAP